MRFESLVALQVIFIFLKLVGVLNWPWMWVFCPLWVVLAVGAAIVMVMAFMIFLAGHFRERI